MATAALALVALLPAAACRSEVDEAAGDEASSAEPRPAGAGAAGLALDDSTRARLVAEFQEVNRQILAIQDRALENPGLRDQQAAVQDLILEEMRKLDAETDRKMSRLEAIRDEAQAAQERGDQQAVMPLFLEMQQLQANLEQTHRQALEQEGVQGAIDSFREKLLAEMKRVDPNAGPLLERAEAIVARLQGGEEEGG